jgi:Rieske Fe-S protein
MTPDSPTAPVPERRAFFRRLGRWVTLAVGGVAAGILGVPLAGFFLGATRKKASEKWVPLGSADSFPPGETRLVTFDNPLRQPWDGMTAHTGVFVRSQGRNGDEADRFLIFAANCAHLGCGVTWFRESGLFMCPCHGGVYYANGERASGPPPRGLFRCVWRIQDGVLEVQAPHYPTLQNELDQRRVALPVTERRA